MSTAGDTSRGNSSATASEGPSGRICTRCGGQLASDNTGTTCGFCQAAGRGKLLNAPDVPPEFWQDDELQAALAIRHMGKVVRAYRRHPWHGDRGLRQEAVSSWAGINQPQLSKIENGPAIMYLDRLIFWAELLRIPQELLWFKLPEGEGVAKLEDVSHVAHEEAEVDRREFLGGAAAIAAGTVASSDRARAGLLGATEFDQLRVAVGRAARPERASQYAALNAVLPGLTVETERMSSEAPGARHWDVVGLLSQIHTLHAWLLIKQDQSAGAKAAATSALNAAQQAEDVLLVSVALRCLGEAHMRAGHYGLACDLGVEAAEFVKRSQTTGQDALAMRGAGYLSAAMACARGGNSCGAGELLEAAHACARQLGRDVTSPAVFGPSNVAIHRIAVPVDLGDSITALQWVEQTNVQLPAGCEERQARYLIDVARAYTDRRRDDDAVHVLLQAEEIDGTRRGPNPSPGPVSAHGPGSPRTT